MGRYFVFSSTIYFFWKCWEVILYGLKINSAGLPTFNKGSVFGSTSPKYFFWATSQSLAVSSSVRKFLLHSMNELWKARNKKVSPKSPDFNSWDAHLWSINSKALTAQFINFSYGDKWALASIPLAMPIKMTKLIEFKRGE